MQQTTLFLARLDEVQEELLYYPSVGVGVGVIVGVGLCGSIGISKKFNIKVFYVMGKALSGELSCPCDRSCFFLLLSFEENKAEDSHEISSLNFSEKQ